MKFCSVSPFISVGRVHEAVPARAEEEARPRDQTAAKELKAEGDPHQEAVQGHLQDTDQAVQGTQGSGTTVLLLSLLCPSGTSVFTLYKRAGVTGFYFVDSRVSLKV